MALLGLAACGEGKPAAGLPAGTTKAADIAKPDVTVKTVDTCALVTDETLKAIGYTKQDGQKKKYVATENSCVYGNHDKIQLVLMPTSASMPLAERYDDLKDVDGHQVRTTYDTELTCQITFQPTKTLRIDLLLENLYKRKMDGSPCDVGHRAMKDVFAALG